jgi:predicted component of type VI protein secretion system
MPPQLVSLTEGPDLLLDKPILLLGRHQECDIQLNSRKISRRHCCIAQVHDHLVIRDLCSTNGIRINGVRVQEGNLKTGDQVTIGNYLYRVEWDMLPPVAAPPKVESHAPEPEGPRLVDHDYQESCEMPVPLPEPGEKAHPLSRPRPPAKGNRPEPAPPRDARIVPDDLSLAPLSDHFRKHDPKPPNPSA